MPSESDLRKSFHDGAAPTGEIDLAAVLRRSRSRRRPRVVMIGAASILAVAAIVVPVSVSAVTSRPAADSTTLAGEAPAPAPESAGGSAADSSAAADSKRAPAYKLNLCTGPLAEVAPAPSGLVLTVAPVDADATAASIPVIVTLTNTGSAPVTGSTGNAPALTLSRDGITLWHSNAPVVDIARVLDLAPGASITYSTTFEPVVCGVDDDLAESFRPSLPAAGPGAYALSAAMDVQVDVVTDTPDAGLELVTGPLAVVTLH